MLPVCLGDWGDWCHGVLEPLKCRPSVNMTKARPALSPGSDTVRATLTRVVDSQIDTCGAALTACRSHVMYGRSSAGPNYSTPEQHSSSQGYNDTRAQGHWLTHEGTYSLPLRLYLSLSSSSARPEAVHVKASFCSSEIKKTQCEPIPLKTQRSLQSIKVWHV